MFVILCAEQSVNLNMTLNDFDIPIVFKVESKLEKQEKESFRAVLERLEVGVLGSIESMLTFVIMAEGFDEDSEYVKRVVKNTLTDISDYPKQANLLMILSIYKYYINGNLPVSFCEAYLGHSKSPISERLCCHMKAFVESVQRWEEGYGNYKVFEVIHRPVAKQVMKELFVKNNVDTYTVLHAFLSSDITNHKFLKQKLYDDVRALLTSRTDFNQQKLWFSRLILDIQSERSFSKAVDLLVKGYNTLDSDPHIAQTIARFHNSEKLFEPAKTWAQRALDSCNKKYTFLDTMGRIYKEELKETKIDSKHSKAELEATIQVGKEAVKYFQDAIKILENQQKSGSIENGYLAEDNFKANLDNSPYFGEIDTNIIISRIIFSLTENADKKKAIARYLQGKNCESEVQDIFEEKISNWRQFEFFLTRLDERTMTCMEKILSRFDSLVLKKENNETQGFDLIKNLARLQHEREKLYYGNQFDHILNKIKNKSPNVKTALIREALKCRLFRNMIYCISREENEFSAAIVLVNALFSFCGERDIENEDMLFFLNIHMAVLYRQRQCPQVEINKLRDMAQKLARRNVPYPEAYFYYTILHWPNEDEDGHNNTRSLPTYDEECLISCISMLKKIQDQQTEYHVEKRTTKLKSPYHRPFYFLAKQSGYNGLEIIKCGGVDLKYIKTGSKERKELYGTVVNTDVKRIIFELPGGTDIEIRPQHHRWLQAINTTQVSFELGFTLAGPRAYNIKEVNPEHNNIINFRK